MAKNWSHSDEELERYFQDPEQRRRGRGADGEPPRRRGFFNRRFDDPRKAQAARWLTGIALIGLLGIIVVGGFAAYLSFSGETPSIQAIENPRLDLATVAYTSDGQELARYAMQNRSWVPFDSIASPVIDALIATEDRRFYDHWGVDLYGIMAAAADVVRKGDLRGASTISQQLARNLYNEQIGFDVSVTRKLKEMMTAVELERRYTKQEIAEMYLNTVSFGYNAYGIESAAQTFYDKAATELDTLQAATLVGMLQATTYYNPVRNPENARVRRNQVLQQMVRYGHLDPSYYEEHADEPVTAEYYSAELHASIAPHYAEYVRQWLREWGKESGHDIYTEGLVVYTTLNSEMQAIARRSVEENGAAIQKVVDYEWSRSSFGGYPVATETAAYQDRSGYEPFSQFWRSKRDVVNSFIRESERFRQLREEGLAQDEALSRLRDDTAFMDSLKTEKTRLEAGFVAIDPQSGYVKAWVGGRGFQADKYDKVAIASRQPGSTFKPFVYTAAIDNGYSPYYQLQDTLFEYVDPNTGDVWSPGNSGNSGSGAMMPLREGLAQSKNTITGRLMLQIGPQTVAFYARRMGIQSELQEVPSLALGTSNVTLLEMTSAYSTLANGGLYYEPTVVTRVEDRYGNVLYEAEPTPEEAISETTAYTVVDMMRGVIDHGTGQRINWQYGLRDYDFAGKTGTTQNSADGWFMLMHPQLVTGAWMGFNDQRVTFRTDFWGQGAHNALFIAGDFWRQATQSDVLQIGNERFPTPGQVGSTTDAPSDTLGGQPVRQQDDEDDRGNVGW